MEERLALELDRRDPVLFDARLGLLQRPRRMVDVRAERPVAAVEAVPLGEEVFEAVRFGGRTRSDRLVRRVERADAVAAACGELRAERVDGRVAIRQAIRPTCRLDRGATGGVEAEEPDPRPIVVADIRAAVQL